MSRTFGIHGARVTGTEWHKVVRGHYRHPELGDIRMDRPLSWWWYPVGLSGRRQGPYTSFLFATKMARAERGGG